MSDEKVKPAELKFHEEQLKKVRNLKPVGPATTKPNFVPRTNVMRKAGRGR